MAHTEAAVLQRAPATEHSSARGPAAVVGISAEGGGEPHAEVSLVVLTTSLNLLQLCIRKKKRRRRKTDIDEYKMIMKTSECAHVKGNGL